MNSRLNKLKISEIDINNSEFERLTAAEKLNNSKYRSLVYHTYPNEPTCGCKSAITEQSTNTQDIDNHKSNENFLVCPGGCKKSCCSRVVHSRVAKNQDNGNYDKVPRIISTYCVENQPSNKVYNSMYCLDERMRGGGGVEEENCECSNWGLTECLKNIEGARKQHKKFRDTLNDNTNDFHELKTYFFSSKFSRRAQEPKSNHHQLNSLPNYTCLKKEDTIIPLKSSKEICIDNNYIPLTCFNEKLKNTQEVVGSFQTSKPLHPFELNGIDPSKSPNLRTFEEQKKFQEMSKIFSTLPPTTNLVCSGPCSPTIKLTTSPWANATPLALAVQCPDETFQKTIIPEAYGEDNYVTGEWSEDDETGPCKESMCKARRKKTDRERSSITVDTGINLNTGEEKKSNNNRKKKQLKLRRRKREMISKSPGNFRSKNKPEKIRYVYLRGKTYPGFIYGHKNCNDQPERVPPNMGWFWTRYQAAGKMKPRVGWKPGAISRQIREIIKDVKDGVIEKKSNISLLSSTDIRVRKLKGKNSSSWKKGHSKKSEEKEELEPPPTLHIQRREGVYYVTMYPIKKKKADIPQLDEPTKPFQFKINTKKDNSSGTTSSTVSDMEIEFSPPAAVNRYRRKPDVVHVETQVRQKEIIDAFKPADDKKQEKKSKKK